MSAPHNDPIPQSIIDGYLMTYRASGLGVYGALLRYIGMPLEKIALYMNSAQVSGTSSEQLRQAIHLTITENGKRSYFASYKVVGAASIYAWFLQYSVMGFIFQVCDTAISRTIGVDRMYYGGELMDDPALDAAKSEENNSTYQVKYQTKNVLAPFLSGFIESVVANRAEVQRYFGIQRFAQIESQLRWNPVSKFCGPAYISNSMRNVIMSSTSFVYTPALYRAYYPQEQKNATSLFWFGLGMNVFIGNTIAITQQALWGRALDYSVAAKDGVARNIDYRVVFRDGMDKEGVRAFITIPKWGTRVLMNAPVQGTLPWFYNEVLPIAEPFFMGILKGGYSMMYGGAATK